MKLLAMGMAATFAIAQTAGCNQQGLPTVEQINFYLPSEVRNCPYAPPSPGKNATKKQTARYIIKLYSAWKQCHSDVQTVNKLYVQYKDTVCQFEYDEAFCD